MESLPHPRRVLCVEIADRATCYAVQLVGSVAEIRRDPTADAHLRIQVDAALWGEIVLGLTGLVDAWHAGRLRISQGTFERLAFWNDALHTGVEPVRPGRSAARRTAHSQGSRETPANLSAVDGRSIDG